jgi:hypothetical protein
MPMKRGDRKTESDDNAANNPTVHRDEPTPSKDFQQILATVRIQRNEAQTERDEANKKVEEKTKQAEEMRLNCLEEHNKYQSTLTLYHTAETQYKSTLALYIEE